MTRYNYFNYLVTDAVAGYTATWTENIGMNMDSHVMSNYRVNFPTTYAAYPVVESATVVGETVWPDV